MGRYRDIVVSPDGLKLYVACDSSGSTSGPTGNVTTTPANPGSILEFTYQPSGPARAMSQLLTETKVLDYLKDKSIDVYPNPARTYFVIYNYSVENRRVQLFDINGRLVRNIQAKELATRVDINDLSNGIYVLMVKGASGKNIRTEKIVIAR
jgi:DNA-binding beta-propeller fold protein YncE